MSEPRTKGQPLCEALRSNPRINAASIDGNVLSTILNAKVDWLSRKQQELPLDSFKENLKKSEELAAADSPRSLDILQNLLFIADKLGYDIVFRDRKTGEEV